MEPVSLFLKAIGLKIVTVVVLVVVGTAGVWLLINAKDNLAATIAGYGCVGAFILFSMYLLIYHSIKEHFQAVVDNLSKGYQDLLGQYVKSNRQQSKRITNYEQAAFQKTTNDPTGSGVTFERYQQSGSETNVEE